VAGFAPGKAGNAEFDGGVDDGATARLNAGALLLLLLPALELAAAIPIPPELPRRVLFFSRTTLFDAFFCAAAVDALLAAAGLADAAEAQPLDAVVAPCIPPSPGREG
jgi:hypothetical protein